MAAGQFAEGVNRLLGTDHAALLQYVTEDHDDRQQGRRQQIPGGPGTQHGQGNQLIGDAVQAWITQAVPGRAHDRYSNQQRSKPQQQLTDTGLLWRQPTPDQAQRQQAQCEHGQGQLACGAALFGRRQQARCGGGLSGHCAAP
ncbi:hypothetical protein D3C78_1579640 [compost metagenome]